MSSRVDLRTSLNAISDVLVNRPSPLREFDQIYMKAGDILVHVDHICSWLEDRNVAFIGDGDAIALSLMHLREHGQVRAGPSTVHVFDFDERVVGSVKRFAKEHDLVGRADATLYNVHDPLPAGVLSRFDAFHSNPPFGKSNGGRSVEVFIRRGIEACGQDCRACVVLADDDDLPWTHEVLFSVQQSVVASGFMVAELRAKAHQYHLDDAPDLRSSTMLLRRSQPFGGPVRSLPISDADRENFYGRGQPLTVGKVKDLCAAGRLPSRDHEVVRLDFTPPLFEEGTHGKA